MANAFRVAADEAPVRHWRATLAGALRASGGETQAYKPGSS